MSAGAWSTKRSPCGSSRASRHNPGADADNCRFGFVGQYDRGGFLRQRHFFLRAQVADGAHDIHEEREFLQRAPVDWIDRCGPGGDDQRLGPSRGRIEILARRAAGVLEIPPQRLADERRERVQHAQAIVEHVRENLHRGPGAFRTLGDLQFGKFDVPVRELVPEEFTAAPDFYSPDELEDLYEVDPRRKVLINVGSVGQPRDRDNRACYVLIEEEAVRFVRVEYDVEAVAKEVYAIPELDDYLGTRLKEGR